MRVLIVEDDVISRNFMQKFLTQIGECDNATNGMDAIDLFLKSIKENNPYSLVCLDIMMPKLDGLKVLKTMRDIEKQYNIVGDKRTKVIMTTAINDQKTVMQSYDSGCEAYAWKPIDVEKFKEVMKNLKLL